MGGSKIARAEIDTSATDPSPWDRAVANISSHFREKGLDARDIPAAIVVHEVIGLALATLAWSACYVLQPSKTLSRPLARRLSSSREASQAQRLYDAAMSRATAAVQRMSWLTRKGRFDPGRLTVSLAESLCFRAAAKPATFVFKIWASYKLVVWAKSGGGLGATVEHT
jgi:hypothetical protein